MCEQNSICSRLWCERNVTLMIMDDSRTAGRGSRMIIYPFGMPRLMVGSVYVPVIYPLFFLCPPWLVILHRLPNPPPFLPSPLGLCGYLLLFTYPSLLPVTVPPSSVTHLLNNFHHLPCWTCANHLLPHTHLPINLLSCLFSQAFLLPSHSSSQLSPSPLLHPFTLFSLILNAPFPCLPPLFLFYFFLPPSPSFFLFPSSSIPPQIPIEFYITAADIPCPHLIYKHNKSFPKIENNINCLLHLLSLLSLFPLH